ncbi:MAG: hypothetical protein ACR2N4_10230 [Jatrophihabitans sp.]
MAAAAAVGVAAAAPASAAPPPVTVICQTATFYQNYNSATHTPETPLDTKTYGQTVGFTQGSNPVYNGSWAQVFDWNLSTWGVILYSCLDHA